MNDQFSVVHTVEYLDNRATLWYGPAPHVLPHPGSSATAKPTDKALQSQLVAMLSAAQTAVIFAGESAVIRSTK